MKFQQPKNIWSLLFYVFPFFIFFIQGIFFLNLGFPSEDALILYRYSEIFSLTNHISFNLNDIPTEGATDFLWMLIIGIFLKIFPIDVAIAGLIINSLGALILFRGLIEIFCPRKIFINKNSYIFFTLIFSLSITSASHITFSSILGFSSLVYCSFGLWVYIYAHKKKYFNWSLVSSIFILIRPEASIFFIGSFLYLLLNGGINKKMLVSSFLVLLVAITYFIWRYKYFQNFFPLPLYVKQNGGNFFENIIDLKLRGIFLIIFMLLIPIFFFSSWKKYLKKNYLFIIILTITIIIYCLLISSGHKTQNVFNRYELPLYLSTAIAFITIYKIFKLRSFLINIILSLIFIFIIFFYNYIFFKNWSFEDHLTKISLSLKNGNIKDPKILLTEAGNIPFWLPEATILDAVGLNNNQTARNPISCKMISDFNPDLIEIDMHGDLFVDLGKFNQNHRKCNFVNTNRIIKNLDNLNFINEYEKNKDKQFVAVSNILYCLKNDNLKNYNETFVSNYKDQIYIINNKSNLYNLLKISINKSCYNEDGSYLDNR